MDNVGNFMKDGFVFFVGKSGEPALRVFAPDLGDAIPYIMKENISDIMVELIDPVGLFEWGKTHDSSTPFREVDSIVVDILPLRPCKQIRSLFLEGEIKNAEVLSDLPALESFSFDNNRNHAVIHIDEMKALRTLWIQKCSKNIVGIRDAIALQEMRLWNYAPQSRDLSEFVNLHALKKLELIRPRIDSLDGIEQMRSLEHVGIYYSRTLKDVSAVVRCKNAVDTVFEHVPALKR